MNAEQKQGIEQKKEPRLRLAKIDEYQFLSCITHGIWGSEIDRFSRWELGELLAFKVDNALAGMAVVTGEPYVSTTIVWESGLYPFRLPIRFVHVLSPNDRPEFVGELRDTVISEWGKNYGWGILRQALLVGPTAATLISAITNRPNRLSEFQVRKT